VWRRNAAVGTNLRSVVSKVSVVTTSRWFAPVFAVLRTARHAGMIAYSYWSASQNEDVWPFIRNDLSGPLFEADSSCGWWSTYDGSSTALQGLDFPAYDAAMLFHSVVTWNESCVDTLMTPRGQIVVVPFVFLLWLLVGLSIRRFAQRRWRRQAGGRLSRVLLSCGLVPAPFALFGLLLGAVGLGASGVGVGIRLAAMSVWFLYLSLLAAERLRVWPFGELEQ
jgi:hypothetical protein